MKHSIFFIICILSSCASFNKFPFPVYLHDQIPAALCTKEISQLGIYRKLNSGKEEFLSYCDINIKNYIAEDSADLAKLSN